MTNTKTPSPSDAELQAMCAEILTWRKTGVLDGDVLRSYAARAWPNTDYALQMAERDVETAALRIVARWGQPQAVAVPLTDERILELAGLAPDRKVCASTCMTAKFEKKPCECYPTSASRSEVVVIARAIEAAHGIKGGQHGAE